MNMQSNRSCPICKSDKCQRVYTKKLLNFDTFIYFNDITIVKCSKCGVLFNNLVTEEEVTNFYAFENQYSSQTSFGTGGLGEGDKKRYDVYVHHLKKYLNEDSIICDVGCAKGGSVAYQSKYFPNNIGIELDESLVQMAQSQGINVLKSELYSYPFEDNSVDCLIYTHVFEHILDFDKVFYEINRVLKKDGLLFIEVPNISEYQKDRVFDFYWFFIREHINHFDSISLNNLLWNHNFKSLALFEQSIQYNNPLYTYPSLIGVFRKTHNQNIGYEYTKKCNLEAIEQYIAQENKKIDLHVDLLNTIFSKYKHIYFWGVGQEFFTIASFYDLQNVKNQIYLLDKNFSKQARTVLNHKIQPPEILKNVHTNDSCVIVCSVFNSAAILEELQLLQPDLHHIVLS